MWSQRAGNTLKNLKQKTVKLKKDKNLKRGMMGKLLKTILKNEIFMMMLLNKVWGLKHQGPY